MRRPSALATLLCAVGALASGAAAGCGSASDQAAAVRSTPAVAVLGATTPAATTDAPSASTAPTTTAPATNPAVTPDQPVPTFAAKPAKTPKPAELGPGPVELDGGVLLSVNPSAKQLVVDVSSVAGSDAGRDADGHVTKPALARGVALVGLKGSRPVTITVDSSTSIAVVVAGKTHKTTLASLAASTRPGQNFVNLRWSVRGTQPRTLAQLVAGPVSSIETATGPGA